MRWNEEDEREIFFSYRREREGNVGFMCQTKVLSKSTLKKKKFKTPLPHLSLPPNFFQNIWWACPLPAARCPLLSLSSLIHIFLFSLSPSPFYSISTLHTHAHHHHYSSSLTMFFTLKKGLMCIYNMFVLKFSIFFKIYGSQTQNCKFIDFFLLPKSRRSFDVFASMPCTVSIAYVRKRLLLGEVVYSLKSQAIPLGQYFGDL